MSKVSIYTDLAQQVAWKYPELSPSPEEARPTNILAMNTYDTRRAASRAERLQVVSRTHGIYFFFRSDCPYCHAYAPMLRSFARQFGFSVLAISLDGRGIPGFEQFVPDNGAAAALKVTQWPATFLVNPGTRDVLSLGAGVMNAEELAERIFQLLEYREPSTQARVAAHAISPQPLPNARSQ
jgi:conjugal transfer pilus assembly protein TraF